MRALSLFSGIGGLDLGLERAGMTIVAQSEVDPYACRVLRRHWPAVPNLGDITELEGADLERLGPIDVVAGGFPCQPVSLAGKGRAQADARWLWPEMARVIRLVRPRVCILENVPGLLARGMGDVLGDLHASGFDAVWTRVGAAHVGAPHRRLRIFVVAWRRDAADAAVRPGELVSGGSGDAGGSRSERSGDPADGPGGDASDAQGREDRRLQQSRLPADPRAGDQGLGRRLELALGAGPAPVRVCGPGTFWERFPSFPGLRCRDDGLPAGVARARLKAIGNAVVPQVAEWVGRCVVEAAR